MQSPVAIQLRQALALFGVPEDDPPVLASARENVASKDQATVKTERCHFLTSQFHWTLLAPLPRCGGRGRRQNRYHSGGEGVGKTVTLLLQTMKGD